MTQTLYNILRESLVFLEFGGSEVLQPYQLTIADYDVLRVLSTEQGTRMGELCERLLLDNSKMTRLVDQLELAGFVQRRRDEQDRRAWQVVLTTPGVELRDLAMAAHERYLQQTFAVLDEDEQHLLSTLLNRVLQPLKSHAK